MYLKKYQIKVIGKLKQFFSAAAETKTEIDEARKTLPEKYRHTLKWVEDAFIKLNIPLSDNPKNGLGDQYPRIVIKVPTGGGKTLLAVEAIREYQNIFTQRRTGLVVWIVPSETIYTQTVKKLRDKGNYLRQLLDQCSGGKTLILEKGQRLTLQDIEENLVVLFVMIQSISRVNGKDGLKVFQDSGGFEGFFPQDNRYDLHRKLIERVANLDVISGADASFPQIRTSLGNAIRLTNPLIIIDEIHKVFSDQARATIDNLNPAMVLGFSATPKLGMNILVGISGLELKDEDMVKLDMHIYPPQTDDWKRMVRDIIKRREKLEDIANKYHKEKGVYIRPIALIQVEATGKDQRGRGRVHSKDVKEFLVEQDISPDEVAIKTSSQNDIEDVDLFSRDCGVRYIITKEALKEGWDCSYAYILGIIPNVNSNTGVTQLVGRILRQPYARKTGIAELDESYVYYVRGNNKEILNNVKEGFKKEGLEDLISKVVTPEGRVDAESKPVKIRKEFKEKYEKALYLPIWLIKESKNQYRPFRYEQDILSQIDFSGVNLSDIFINNLAQSLSDEHKDRREIIITLDQQSKMEEAERVTGYEQTAVSMSYVSRRFAEVIENPFLARRKAQEFMKIIEKHIGIEKVTEHFGYITARLIDELTRELTKQEEEIFVSYLKLGRLILAVTDDEKIGFRIPEKDVIIARVRNRYQYYLYDDVELESMNELEQKVGDILDRQKRILWWFRNKLGKNWYAIQGWKKHKIRPDFVAAKRNEKGELELVYVLESKGEHLKDNKDSQYKNAVMKKMNETRVTAIQMKVPFKVNENVEFYLVEQGEEEEKLKKLMK